MISCVATDCACVCVLCEIGRWTKWWQTLDQSEQTIAGAYCLLTLIAGTLQRSLGSVCFSFRYPIFLLLVFQQGEVQAPP